MPMTKRKPSKRRKQHRLAYYLAELTEDKSLREIINLRVDAAHQPRSVISDNDYERIYWRAHELLERKENDR